MPSMRANISGVQDQVHLCCSESIHKCLQQPKTQTANGAAQIRSSVHDNGM